MRQDGEQHLAPRRHGREQVGGALLGRSLVRGGGATVVACVRERPFCGAGRGGKPVGGVRVLVVGTVCQRVELVELVAG